MRPNMFTPSYMMRPRPVKLLWSIHTFSTRNDQCENYKEFMKGGYFGGLFFKPIEYVCHPDCDQHIILIWFADHKLVGMVKFLKK